MYQHGFLQVSIPRRIASHVFGPVGTRIRKFGAVVSGVLLISQGLPVAALAATIQTDLFVYQNGDTVTVTGDGFGATEIVDLVTTDPAATVVNLGTATSDGEGNLTYQFSLTVTVAGLYTVNATGQTTGLSASTQFDPGPDLSNVTPASKDFGTVGVGLSSASASFSVKNNGTQANGVTVSSTDSTNFVVNPTSLGQINAGATVSFIVTFTPQSFGAKSATLTIADNNNSTNGTATVTGTTPATRTTTTSVSCAPPAVITGSISSCTVTVTDGSSGTPTTPSGSVSWSSSGGGGSFNSLSCGLSGSGATGACSVAFTPAGATGSRTIAATYAARADHSGSSGSATVTLAQSGSSLSVAPASGTHGGTTNLSATLTSGGSGVGGKTISFSMNGTPAVTGITNSSGVATVSGASLSGINAGSYLVIASFAGDPAYASSSGSASLTVGPKSVSPSVTATSRAYDGTTTVAVAACSLSGVVGSDSVSCDSSTASANFSDKNVGTGKRVTVTGLRLAGTAAANYTLSSTSATTTANITTNGLTVNFATANKVYDSNTTATITGCSLSGVVPGDTVTCVFSAATAHFADKNVGNGKAVIGTGFTLSGAGAGNYSIGTARSTANITARDLAVTAAGVNKLYDGTATATVTLTTDNLSGDDVSASYAVASFVNKDVGTSKPVSVSGIAISGPDAGNYHLTNTTATTTASITIKSVVISFTAQSRTYDGTNVAAITGCSLSGASASDDVSCDRSGASAAFVDKNVGTGKAVTGTGFALTGADDVNYSFTVDTATADITKRDLIVTAASVSKVYDATTTTTATLSTDEIAGDEVTATYTTASFADKSVGTGKAVTVSGISISGADAQNYLANTTASTTADITQRDLTVSATGVDKVYDGNTTATINLSTDKVLGDAVNAASTSATFDTRNVASDKAVTVNGISISGADAANYHLTNTTAGTTAAISARDLHVSADGVNKIYDGDNTTTVTLSSDSLLGDDVTLDYASAAFADKNVGNGKAVSVSGISISGADATNYNLVNTSATTAANITQRNLSVGAHGVNKEYDTTTDATVTLSTDKLAGDDVVASFGTASFADKNVGTDKAVSVSGITIWGDDAANYHLLNTTASTTADITARNLTVTAQADDKSKILGAGDPPLTFTVTSGAIAVGDSWTGGLERDAGETVGAYTIRQGTLNVTDGNAGNNYAVTFIVGTFRILYATSGTCSGEAGHVILRPISSDGSTVHKQGSTVPAKFRVCDANGNSIGPPANGSVVQSFTLWRVISGTVSPTTEPIISTTPDTNFRWDATGKQWVFNISTKNLSPNMTYQYVIILNDGSMITFQFGLR